MDLKDLVIDAYSNAKEKGFHLDEELIIQKMYNNKEFTRDDIIAVKNAFRGQKLMLIVSEVSEALEALRKGDEENFKEEIADVLIRLADFSGSESIDLEHEVTKKMEKNKLRGKKHGKNF